jgi:hypothetical protein
MGAAAAPIAIGLTVASSLFEGYGQMKADNAAAKADLANAHNAEMQGAFEIEAIRRKERAVSGEAVAAMAGNGVSIGTGSALDLLRQNAVDREMDILGTRYNAVSQANSYRERAKQEKRAGKFALFGGVLRAGASALTGVSSLQTANAVSASNSMLRGVQAGGGQALPIPAGLGFAPTTIGTPGYVKNPDPGLKY